MKCFCFSTLCDTNNFIGVTHGRKTKILFTRESLQKSNVSSLNYNKFKNVYRTVSHNFKFDFLPRLAAERDELKAKIDKYKDEEEDIGKQIEDIR